MSRSKLDTNNGSYNAVHAEDIELKGDEVSFLLLGKKRMTLPVKETKRIHLGGGEFEDRPVVQLNMSLGRKGVQGCLLCPRRSKTQCVSDSYR